MNLPLRLILIAVAIVSGVPAAFAQGADPASRGLIERGRQLFMTETFDGNGRTCASCHPPANNFTIDPAFIATLPDDDPLFVAEFNPDLAELEDPETDAPVRADPRERSTASTGPGVFRGVPHTLGLRVSMRSTPPATKT